MVHMDVTVCWKYLFIALVSIVSDKCCKSNNKNVHSITFCHFFYDKNIERAQNMQKYAESTTDKLCRLQSSERRLGCFFLTLC